MGIEKTDRLVVEVLPRTLRRVGRGHSGSTMTIEFDRPANGSRFYVVATYLHGEFDARPVRL